MTCERLSIDSLLADARHRQQVVRASGAAPPASAFAGFAGGACPIGTASTSLNRDVGAELPSRQPAMTYTLWAGWFDGDCCASDAATGKTKTMLVAKTIGFIELSSRERSTMIDDQRNTRRLLSTGSASKTMRLLFARQGRCKIETAVQPAADRERGNVACTNAHRAAGRFHHQSSFHLDTRHQEATRRNARDDRHAKLEQLFEVLVVDAGSLMGWVETSAYSSMPTIISCPRHWNPVSKFSRSTLKQSSALAQGNHPWTSQRF